MTLTSFTIIEMSTCIATILGSCGMLLAVTQKSRCKKFRCCCGLIDCDREIIEKPLPDEDQEKIDITVDDDVDESKTQEKPTLNIPVPKIVNKIPISQTKV